MSRGHKWVKTGGGVVASGALSAQKCSNFAFSMQFRQLALISIVLGLGACSAGKPNKSAETPIQKTEPPKTMTTASGLEYVITNPGTGENPKPGQTVSVHYVGKLTDGTEFDNSYKRGEPIQFVLGKGMVIQGWDEGIALLNKGAKGTLTIPPALGYGSRGAGGVIPPNATLVFDVELVDFK